MTTPDDDTSPLIDRLLADLFTATGHAKDLADDHLAALRYFEEVVRRDPASALGWYNLGDTLLAMHRAPQAAEALGRAVALRPDDPLCNYGLGLALYELGRFVDAATHLRVAVGPDRALIRAQSTLGLNAVTTLALGEEQFGDAAGGVTTLEPARWGSWPSVVLPSESPMARPSSMPSTRSLEMGDAVNSTLSAFAMRSNRVALPP